MMNILLSLLERAAGDEKSAKTRAFWLCQRGLFGKRRRREPTISFVPCSGVWNTWRWWRGERRQSEQMMRKGMERASRWRLDYVRWFRVHLERDLSLISRITWNGWQSSAVLKITFDRFDVILRNLIWCYNLFMQCSRGTQIIFFFWCMNCSCFEFGYSSKDSRRCSRRSIHTFILYLVSTKQFLELDLLTIVFYQPLPIFVFYHWIQLQQFHDMNNSGHNILKLKS